MRKKYLIVIGCSILMLCACGNNATTENNTTEEITTTESVQEPETEMVINTEEETEIESVSNTEEVIETTESIVSDSQDKTPSKETSETVEVAPSTEKVYSIEDLDGDGYADLGPTTEFNGFLLPTEQITVDAAKLDQAICNAGYYNPIYWNNGCYYMIVPYGEWDAGADWLDAWLTAQGLAWESIGGGDYDLGSRAEVLCADVY